MTLALVLTLLMACFTCKCDDAIVAVVESAEKVRAKARSQIV
jgi:hypothetical protein